ncbi:hypothetical protein BWI17_18650 [Betaproteobacteria bacterium GR16-43]|nr:hypothetical protein BWI17_18650 [Betaproteobacteria bacterium GR16-43]
MKAPVAAFRARMRDASIQAKLTGIALATVFAAIVVLGLVLAAGDFLRYRQDTEDVLRSHAQITATNASAAVAFRDAVSARQTLAALHVSPAIERALIFDDKGRFFAEYFRGGTWRAPPEVASQLEAPRVTTTGVTLDHPIEFSDDTIGFVRVEGSFRGYVDSLGRFLLALLVAAAAALAAALMLVLPLRAAVARPIQGLAQLMARVRRDGDYSLRVATPARDELGSLAESFNAMLDVIEQRDTHLARERDLVHTILDTMDAAVLVVDAQGTIVEANGAFLRAVDKFETDCTGEPVWEAAGVDDAQSFLAHLAHGERFEAALRPTRGEPRPFAWRSSRTLDAGSRSALTVVTAIDIADHKRVEATLRRAKEAAEAASLSKSRFVANMSHEIRTPMNGILGMAHVMHAASADDAQRHSLETIIASGEALLRILNDILDFSKIEAGRLDIVGAPFAVHEYVEDSVQVFAAEARGKGLALRLTFSDDVPDSAWGDSLRLRQVLSNLIGNAIKFTQSGSIGVHVDLAPGDGELRFAVTDTGVGLSPEAHERIFEAFTQADSTTQREYGGTGLGLSISRQLVTLMGGRMGMESRPGEGSTFWFAVPLPREVSAVPPRLPARLGVHVLLADGESGDRSFERQRMLSWGASVDIVASAAEARDKLGDGTAYHAVLLDDALPGGWRSVVSHLEATPELASVPVALMGMGAPADPLPARVTLEIPKPVKSSTLYNFLFPQSPMSARVTGGTGRRIEASVLLVEDNPVNIDVACAMLSQAGCTVSVARDGREALAVLETRTFDLVLMDCQLPGMDGYTATRLLREREAGTGRHQRIVAVTAHALSGDREACLAAGMDDYLPKPFSPVQLQSALEANVGSVPGAGAAAPAAAAAPEEPVQCAEAIAQLRALEAEGHSGLIERMVGHFEKQSAASSAALRAALEGGSREDAAQAVHCLRSTVAHLGGRRLAAACQAAELASEDPAADLGAAARRYEEEVAVFRAVLSAAGPAGETRIEATAERPRRQALVVDDDENDRMFLGRALQSVGFDVLEAATIVGGLELVSQHAFDVLMLDRHIGVESGIANAPEFRRLSRKRPLPIILVTGLVSPRVEGDASAAGIPALLQKPTNWGEFPARLAPVLARLLDRA